MQEFINEIINTLQMYINSCPFIIGVLIGSLVIVLESILPMLPLGVFIALNMILIGNILGFIVSWISTSIGCLLSYTLVKKFFSKKVRDRFKENKQFNKIMNKIDKIPLNQFVVITALPFTPAFLINISAGLSKMNVKKFMIGILISKVFVVYFWGFVGTTLIQSITDVKVLVELAIMLLSAYVISKFVMKKYNLD